MQSWEYKTIKIPFSKGWNRPSIDPVELDIILNKLGSDGWELVSVLSTNLENGRSEMPWPFSSEPLTCKGEPEPPSSLGYKFMKRIYLSLFFALCFSRFDLIADDSLPFIQPGEIYSFDRVGSESAIRYKYVTIGDHIKNNWFSMVAGKNRTVIGWINLETGLVIYPAPPIR